MEKVLNQEELHAIIAKEIRAKGLNEVLKLETIKERVIKKIRELKGEEQETQINELENPNVATSAPREMPREDEDDLNPPEAAQTPSEEVQVQMSRESGDTPLDVPMEPRRAVNDTPEFLKEIEPGKIVIFDYNELSESGLNLTNKPLRTYDNPDIRKSMSELWSEGGRTKAEVFQTKYEKIGDLEYDYKNGVTRFVENTEQPNVDVNGVYKENPYKVESNPVIEKDIESYITQNVDMDSKVNDVIANIVKDYFLTNSEKAVNDLNAPESTQNPAKDYPLQNIAEAKLNDLMKVNTEYSKIDTPKALLETIDGKSNEAKLVYENKEVKKYTIKDKEYFLPTDALSVRKCYIK